MRLDVVSFLSLLLLVSPALATFGCFSETCTVDGAIWNCNYVNCTERPNFINQTNVTTINVESVNCNTSSLEAVIRNQTTELYFVFEQHQNTTANITDCQESKTSCVAALSTCQDTVTQMEQDASDYSQASYQLQACEANATSTQRQLKTAESDKTTYAIGAALLTAIAIWYFKLRKEQPSQRTVEPTRGLTSFNPDAIEKRSREQDLKNEIDELKNVIKGKYVKKPKQKQSEPVDESNEADQWEEREE